MSTTAGVRERPILMSGPMVRAILAGRKTQTRRVVKHPGDFLGAGGKANREEWDDPDFWGWEDPENPSHFIVLAREPCRGDVPARCPYGASGDRLWLRESWRCNPYSGMRIEYRAGGACLEYDRWPEGAIPPYAMPGTVAAVRRSERQLDGERVPDPWRPSIHMPRWASRITLEVADIRVERLQAITEEDARAEGAREAIHDLDGRAWDRAVVDWCRLSKHIDPEAKVVNDRGAFAAIWDRINGKSHPWASNPWVWAITFRRIEDHNHADR